MKGLFITQGNVGEETDRGDTSASIKIVLCYYRSEANV